MNKNEGQLRTISPQIITKFTWMTDKTCALHDSLTAQGKVVVYKGDKYFKLVYKIEKSQLVK